MTITNGYATLDEFKARKTITTTDALEDPVIEFLIQSVSRAMDNHCGRTFFARTETRYFDMPRSAGPLNDEAVGGGSRPLLMLDDDLLAVTTLTNGDGTTIAAAQYHLLPYNSTPKYALLIKRSSSVAWLPDSSGNLERVISIAGSWGMVDRAAGSPTAKQQMIIDITKQICLDWTIALYAQLQGESVEGVAQVTAAGVVVTPASMPAKVKQALDRLVRAGVDG